MHMAVHPDSCGVELEFSRCGNFEMRVARRNCKTRSVTLKMLNPFLDLFFGEHKPDRCLIGCGLAIRHVMQFQACHRTGRNTKSDTGIQFHRVPARHITRDEVLFRMKRCAAQVGQLHKTHVTVMYDCIVPRIDLNLLHPCVLQKDIRQQCVLIRHHAFRRNVDRSGDLNNQIWFADQPVGRARYLRRRSQQRIPGDPVA